MIKLNIVDLPIEADGVQLTFVHLPTFQTVKEISFDNNLSEIIVNDLEEGDYTLQAWAKNTSLIVTKNVKVSASEEAVILDFDDIPDLSHPAVSEQ